MRQTTEEDKRPLLENEEIEPEPRSYQVIRPPTPVIGQYNLHFFGISIV